MHPDYFTKHCRSCRSQTNLLNNGPHPQNKIILPGYFPTILLSKLIYLKTIHLLVFEDLRCTCFKNSGQWVTAFLAPLVFS